VRTLLVVALIASSSLWSLGARASDKSNAEALFEEGLRLFDAKDYAGACARFTASQKLDPAVGTLLNLGRCYESAGHVASAHDAYADAILQAQRENDAPREKLARQKEAELAPLVPKLTILVPSGASRLHVERNGEVVSPATLAGPIPLDPGDQEIVATEPGKKPFSAHVVLAAGDNKKLTIPALASDEASAPLATSSLDTQRVMALAAGSAAVLALGVGTYFGLRASSLHSDAGAHCNGNICDADGVSLTDRASGAADLSTGLFVGGVVLGVGALVLWATAPDRSSVAFAPGRASFHVRF
jgi:hypothetical protein